MLGAPKLSEHHVPAFPCSKVIKVTVPSPRTSIHHGDTPKKSSVWEWEQIVQFG